MTGIEFSWDSKYAKEENKKADDFTGPSFTKSSKAILGNSSAHKRVSTSRLVEA